MIMSNIISKRLKELRNREKLSIRGLTKLINISPSTYFYYEKGTRILPCDVLVTICKFYNVPSDYIVGLVDIY